jgi:hypothetical protein
MKTFTFSGMTTCTARSDFNITVTAEDISEDSVTWTVGPGPLHAIVEHCRKYSVEDVEAWTDEQVRAYVEEHMLDERVREGEGGGHVYDTYYEYDDDMEMVVGEHDGEDEEE